MAHAHLPKHGLRSPAVVEEKYPGSDQMCRWGRCLTLRVLNDGAANDVSKKLCLSSSGLEKTAMRTPTIEQLGARSSVILVKSKSALMSAIVILFVLGTSVLGVLGGESSYEATGEVECLAIEDGITNRYRSFFVTQCSGCKSVIRSKLVVDDDQRDVDYHEYAYQGSNSTLLIRYRDDLLITNLTTYNLGKAETVTLDKAQKPVNQATLMIRADELPPYGFEHLTIVWLAFSAACHYKSTDTNSVTPVLFAGAGFRESGLKVRSKWALFDTDGNFLEFMTEFSDGNKYEREGNQIRVRPLPSPYNAGFTNAFFRVSEWTMVDKSKVPKQFELFAYQPDAHDRTEGKLSLRYKMMGTMRDFKFGTTRTNFASDLPARCRVVDYTHPDTRTDANYFTYLSKDGQLLDYDEFAKRQKAILATLPRHRGNRWVVFVLTAVSAALLFIFLATQMKSKNSSYNQ